MKMSRRGILAGLLATSAAPAAAVEHEVELPKPKFIKGMIMPVSRLISDPLHHRFGSIYAEPSVVFEYNIFDGTKFVALNSSAGQRVIEELGG